MFFHEKPTYRLLQVLSMKANSDKPDWDWFVL